MPTIACPECGKDNNWPEDRIGDRVECPSCGKFFTLSRSERFDDRPPSRRDYDDDDRGPSRRRGLAPHRGTLILVLGILAFVGAGIFTAIPAWIMGNHDLKEIREGRMDPEGESLTNIGRILGMISTILTVVSLFCICGFYAVAATYMVNAKH